MSQDHDDAFLKFVLGLIAVVVGIIGIFYLCSFLMPIILFYGLPFIVLSLSAGSVLWFLVQNGEGSFEKVNEYSSEKIYVPRFDFRVLAITYPFLILMTFLVFEAGSTKKEITGKTGQVEAVIEWPGVHKTYNKMRSNWFRDSMFESLRIKAREPVLFDRSDLGNIVWLTLIFGGPFFFFWLSRNAAKEESVQISKVVDEKTEKQKAHLRTLIHEQDAILKRRQKPLEDEIEKLRAHLDHVVSENQVLKAQMEFGAQAAVVKVLEKAKAPGNGGVLDGELL